MYKIDYNGFKIETDSVIEVKQLLETVEEKPTVNSKKKKGIPLVEESDFGPAVSKPKKKRKILKRTYVHNRWTVPEIQFITENIKDFGTKRMIKNSNLLQKHTKAAIRTMCYRVNSTPNNYKRQTSKKVQKVISDYQKTRKDTRGFFGGEKKSSLLDD
ncbi:MAG TPA: hypothetical protein ENH99_01555 [Candidatus Pacearchaeota archaeon]|nr:hypothetical protein [Candidatus Pacearchaeota archaeon]